MPGVRLDPAAYTGQPAQRVPHVGSGDRRERWKLSEVSRHKSLDTLRGVRPPVDLFKEHAGAAFL
jgi:hypothetical protein